MQNRTLEGVFFDLDGTLLDTAPDFHAIVQDMLLEFGYPAIEYDEFRKSVSNGALAMLTSAFKLDPHSELLTQKLHPLMLDRYEAEPARFSGFFDGIESLLEQLESHKIPWGLVTNKPERFTSPLLRQLQLDSRSHATICPDHVQNTKPDPESLLMACQKTDTLPQNCVYIGDHKRDIEAGKNAGMFTIGALYGYIDSEEDPCTWQADAYVTEAGKIHEVIFDHFNLTR